jgi:hypothetical protein
VSLGSGGVALWPAKGGVDTDGASSGVETVGFGGSDGPGSTGSLVGEEPASGVSLTGSVTTGWEGTASCVDGVFGSSAGVVGQAFTGSPVFVGSAGGSAI